MAAFLWAQIENLDKIQTKRLEHWFCYFTNLKNWALANNIELMLLPNKETNNGHLFHLICESELQRTKLIHHLKINNIHAVFHYISLHSSPFYKAKHDGRALENSDKFTNRLLRLPMYFELDTKAVVDKITSYGI